MVASVASVTVASVASVTVASVASVTVASAILLPLLFLFPLEFLLQ
jgi:hypothetical protein